MERGCTHFTHWFQPLTGSTAEKHDSFYNPTGDGNALAEFSGKELIQGEPDASSFPTGGIRATFEARGYTAWDPSSPAFILENPNGALLCIPTAFASWTGEALDHKIPLLRSMDALSRSAVRALQLLGDEDAKRVFTTIGPEQEYFLIDETLLLRAPRPRDHRPHAVRRQAAQGPRARRPLLRLDPRARAGLHARRRAARWPSSGSRSRRATTRSRRPSTSSRRCSRTRTSGSDHQQLCMQILQNVARRYELVCLLHEKPFAGVNGSGKHNNWSFGTDTGINLLEPGDTPHENLQFLFFCTAVLAGRRPAPGAAARLDRLGRAGPPARRQRGAAGDHLDLPRRRAAEGLRRDRERARATRRRRRATSSSARACCRTCRCTAATATARRRSRSRATSSSSARSAPRSRTALPNTVLNTIAAQAIDAALRRARGAARGRRRAGRGRARRGQGVLRRPQADRVQRRQLRRGVAQGGRGARAARTCRQTPDALPALVSRVGRRGDGRLRRALRARAGVALRGVRRAVRRRSSTSRPRRRSRSPRRCCCPAAVRYLGELGLAGESAGDQRRRPTRSRGLSTRSSTQIGALEIGQHEPPGRPTTSLEEAQVRPEHRRAGDGRRCARSPTQLERVVPDSLWPLPKYSEILFIK